MRNISWGGVLAGSLVDIVATSIFATAYGAYPAISRGLVSLAPDQIANEMAKLQAEPLVYWTQFSVGSLFSVLGGYVAARIAKRAELLNASLTAVLGILLGFYFVLSQTNDVPLWLNIISFIATPVFATLGGYLRLKTARWDATQATSTAPSQGWAATLARNTVNSLRLAAFLRVPEDRMPATWWQVPVFALAGIVFASALSFWQTGVNGQFAWYSLPSSLFPTAILVLAGIFMGYALGRSDNVIRIVLGFLMAALAIDVIGDVVGLMFPEALIKLRRSALSLSLPNLTTSVWLAAACAVFALRMSQRNVGRAIAVVAVCVATIGLPLSYSYYGKALWYPKPSEDETAGLEMPLSKEGAFYEQARLLEQELQRLRAGPKGVVNVYFIGMAGDAQQDVFMKEVNAVSKLFSQRFHAEGRTVSLINNPKSVTKTPIASSTSLSMALKRVGQVMDKDEDILVLFMTSHGSEQHHFTLNFWPLQFNALDPARLRALLDESGVRDRVIVVSACYAGGFIDALKNEHTLVITAAAKDRTSFGCSNEAEWTYFGKAYFDEALRQTYSFVDAFDRAKPVIAGREKQQNFEGSDPQIFVGSAIREKLGRLERELRASLQ
jgi:hypothetical protein